MERMGDTSIVTGWVPLVFYVLTPIALVLAFGWRDGVWKKQVLIGAAAYAVFVPLVYVLNENLKLIPYEFPVEFYLWSGLIVFAIAVAIAGFRRDANLHRVMSVVAVLLTCALLGLIVNRQYRYYPTIANLFGKVAENEVSVGDLNKIEQQTRESKTLPAVGSTVNVPIPGTKSGFQARNAYVYLPPVYFADPSPNLPVLVMLHGIPGGPDNWEQAADVDTIANAFAAQNGGKVPILVMPDYSGTYGNDTQCADSGRGKAETYLTQDVPDYMREHFHAATDRSQWGVVGFSTGGYCSMMLSLRHPDVFSVAGSFSADTRPTLDPPGNALKEVFGGNQQLYDSYDATKILQTKKFDPPQGIWLEAGADDPAPTAETQAVAKLFKPAGIESCLVVRPGGHDFAFWEQAFRNALPWLSSRVGLTPAPSDLGTAHCT